MKICEDFALLADLAECVSGADERVLIPQWVARVTADQHTLG